MLLYIVRHGDPIYNPECLTPKGHLQAQALAKRFGLHGLDKIYVSPLNRARQTAQPTCELLGITPQIENWTSEDEYYSDLAVKHEDGRITWVFHQQRTNLKNDDTINLGPDWYKAECLNYPGKDFKKTYERLQKSSDEFLARLGYERHGSIYKITHPNEERVAVFCHQAFGVTWLSHLLSISPLVFWTSFDISHSGVSILKFDNYDNGITTPICLSLSDLSHIYREGLPYEYNNTDPL